MIPLLKRLAPERRQAQARRDSAQGQPQEKREAPHKSDRTQDNKQGPVWNWSEGKGMRGSGLDHGPS